MDEENIEQQQGGQFAEGENLEDVSSDGENMEQDDNEVNDANIEQESNVQFFGDFMEEQVDAKILFLLKDHDYESPHVGAEEEIG